jgi:hypothetical protein
MSSTTKPDHDIEQFWLAFKQSMKNFYGQTGDRAMPARPISDWSERLNRLQKAAKYETIEHNIYNFMTLYGIDLLRVGDRYHLGILITNIKRWNKIAAKYPFHDRDGCESRCNLIFILLEIVNNFIKCDLEFDNLFSDIELYLIHEDYTNLLDFAIKHNKPVIIDKLMSFDSLAVINSLNTYWHLGMEISNDYKKSGKKIIELISQAASVATSD